MVSAMSTCESFSDLSCRNQRFKRMLGESITIKGLGLEESYLSGPLWAHSNLLVHVHIV